MERKRERSSNKSETDQYQNESDFSENQIDTRHEHINKKRILWRNNETDRWYKKSSSISDRRKNYQWKELRPRNKDVNNRLERHQSHYWMKLIMKHETNDQLKERNHITKRYPDERNIWMAKGSEEDI